MAPLPWIGQPNDLIPIENLGDEYKSLLDSALPKGLTFGYFLPKIVMVESNMDISRFLVSFARENNGEIYVLLAVGNISLAQILQGDKTTTLEGTYGLADLRGKCVIPENEADVYRMDGLNISVVDGDFRVIDGTVNGHLIAASPCQLWLATKIPESPQKAPPIGSTNRNSKGSTSASASASRKRPRGKGTSNSNQIN